MNVLRYSSCQPGTGSVRLHAVASAGVLACLLSGCMTSKVDETRQVAGALHPNDAIVVLKKPQLEGWAPRRISSTACSRTSAASSCTRSRGRRAKCRKTSRTFHSDLRRAGIHGRPVPVVRAEHCTGQRRRAQDVTRSSRCRWTGSRRSVCATSSGSTATRRRPTAAAAWPAQPDPGGAGCIGIGWWEKHSDYVASVWDLQTAVEMGSVTTDVKGTSVLIGAIAPIPIISPVQSTACNPQAIRNGPAADRWYRG